MAITFVNLIVSSEIIHTVCGVNVLYKTSWIDFGILRERFIEFLDIQILKIKDSHLTVSSRDKSFMCQLYAYISLFKACFYQKCFSCSHEKFEYTVLNLNSLLEVFEYSLWELQLTHICTRLNVSYVKLTNVI